MNGVGREFFLELCPHRLANVLAIGSDLDAAIFHRFIFKVLRHPRFDQHVVLVRTDRPEQILHGLGRHLIVQTRSHENILGFLAEGLQSLEYRPLDADICVRDKVPRWDQVETLCHLANDRSEAVNHSDIAGANDDERFRDKQ